MGASAAWTLALLMATVGVYRWGLILFARAGIASFPSDAREGAGWYQRGTRAHANCIENLPVFGAIVYLVTTLGLTGPMVDIYKKARGLFPQRPCEVFYSGSVTPPR